MSNLPEDVSSPDDITGLENEILRIEAELDDTDITLRTLLAAENPSSGIFHAKDIHALRQRKLTLISSREILRNKIKRIRFESGTLEQ